MAVEINDYSKKINKILNKIVTNNSFYKSLSIADIPFSEALVTDSEGLMYIKDFFQVEIDGQSTVYTVTLRKSKEQKCWFFNVKYDTEEYDGIVQYNTLNSNQAPSAFVFINGSDGASFEDITRTLAYSSFAIFRK